MLLTLVAPLETVVTPPTLTMLWPPPVPETTVLPPPRVMTLF